MESKLVLVLLIFNLVLYVKCPYPPTGEEVVPGSVLLPASRRGRYLANIVRRQATDGTGIKFNKDADRMNAEAKKKVDVLSDELLPYIIAEQERRTTLYKRIMTAIQNGEKGVTIAEIRNKPPLIIRKGVMYRCPANRAPKEPDGSGVLLCEEAIEPTQIMYDSCLSAEDKDLYVAENKYFFCNRHRIEGPDLPRNGSTVIGCAPTERTSLNYTTGKCALEDTDDIVVHYRYYPDRTYKFVMELDPDHEVCDHWNPCQIGYIYSLPGPDQALPATDLWRNTPEKVGELVPPIPEDSNDEFVSSGAPNYSSSPRKVPYPGKKATRRTGASTWKFEKVWAKRNTDGYGWNPAQSRWRTRVVAVESEHYVTITLHFPENFDEFFFSSYYVIFSNSNGQHAKSEKFLTITQSKATVKPEVLHMTYGETGNNSDIPYHCLRCHIQSIMIRTPEGHVHNLDSTRTRIKEALDQTGRPKQFLEIRVGQLKPQEFGDFYAIIQNADGMEERIKVLIVREKAIKLTREKASLEPSAHLDRSIKFECDDCELTDVKWNGQSAIAAGKIAFVPVSKMITINLPSFDDSSSGVYLALFKKGGEIFQKIVLVIDNSVSGVTVGAPEVVAPPLLGEQFEKEITYSCDDCTLEQVVVNGIALESTPNTRRNNGNSVGSIAYYLYTPTTITIRIIEYTPTFEGVYQAIFNIGGENVTKTIFEIGEGSSDSAAADTATEVATEAAQDAGGETTHAEEETTVEGGAEEETTVPAEGHEEEATVPAEGDAETEATEGGEATEGEDAAEAETEAAAEEGRRQLGSTTDKGTTIVGITVKGTTVEGTTVKGTTDKGTTDKGTTEKGTTDKSTTVEKTTERPSTATA